MNSSILSEADRVAGADRSAVYGHPMINHQRIAAMWSILLDAKLQAPISAREVALMMIALKMSREIHAPRRDNLVDIAGYVKCIEMIDDAAAPYEDC